MIKYAIILATVAVMAFAQRPPYAGTSNRRYPQVLPQYLPSVANEVDATTEIGLRIGEDAASTTPNLDVKSDSHYDPYNDPVLLAQINTWPRDKQPFWYINRQQIQEQIRGTARTMSNSRRSIYAGGR